MSLVFGGTTVNNIVFNGTTVDRIVFNGVEVYTSKPAKFMYWNGEYGQYTYAGKPYNFQVRLEAYWSGNPRPIARVGYLNSDGIHVQDDQEHGHSARPAFVFQRQLNQDFLHSPLIIKDLYVAIDNFVGNPTSVTLYFYIYSENWEGRVLADYPIEQTFNISGNTVLQLHANYVEFNNFSFLRIFDNTVSGTSYAIRRVWYDTY